MLVRPLLFIGVLLLSTACRGEPEPQVLAPPTPQVATQSPAQQRIAQDMRTLASDEMAGRLVGTAGYRQASDYVAEQMQAAGLQPAGDDGSWFQTVPLLRAVRQREGAALSVQHADRVVSLRFADQFLPQPDFNHAAAQVQGDAVFVRQAVHAPDFGVDDFAGLNLQGKVAVLFLGAPESLPANPRAHYSALASKLSAVAERGAVAAVLVNSGLDEAGTPWAVSAANWQRPAMRLRDANGRALDAPALQVVARVSASAADLLFDGSGQTAAQVHQAMQTGAAGFNLPVSLQLASRSQIEPLDSRNVLGRLPGQNANRAAETIAYTAHLDHLGEGAHVDGDAIYNGALDNALGVAIMLESARELAEAEHAPVRSVLFAALTAEEHGLLGAHYLVRHPPAGTRLIANLNIDMPLLLAPSTDAVAIGAEHSQLGEVAQRAADQLGLVLSPDPFPEETAFVRSDQYAFVRAGIPALYLDAGVISADGQRMPDLAQRNFMRQHYHQPSDDADLPVYWPDAQRMAQWAAAIGRLLAEAEQPPRFHADDFFEQLFGRNRAE